MAAASPATARPASRVRHLTYHYLPERKWPQRPVSKPLAIDKRPADPRQAMRTEAASRGLSLAELSRMLSRPAGYLGRFVRDGVPRCLTSREHRLLADALGLDERALGIRDLWAEG